MADRTPPTKAKPHLYSLVAAAQVISSKGIRKPVQSEGMLAWQERAWTAYDEVGEFRFGIGWLANAMSRVNLTAASTPENIGDEPTAIIMPSLAAEGDPAVTALADEQDSLTPVQKRAVELVEYIAGGASGQGQLLSEFGTHLNVAGFGWLVAEPDREDPEADTYEDWGVYSQDAIKITGTGESATIQIREGDGGTSDWRTVHKNALVVKCWRKHPRRPWQPDAPVRASLQILDMLDLLTAHVTATARSRLAGAGILAIASEADFPPPPAVEGEDPDNLTADESRQINFNHFVEEMVEHFITPITDRNSAAAVVPFPVAIPGEWVDKIKHIAFSTPFDERVLALTEAAIKRLSLGMDMPPEVLTGMAGVNHWTAWQVEDTAITLHIEPAAEIVCRALTTGYLVPALEAEGYSEDDIASVMCWYDTSDLSTPPDLSGNVKDAYDRKEASGKALRHYLGMSEEDAPSEEEFLLRTLLEVAKGAPSLAPAMLAEAGLLDPAVADAAAEADPAAEVPAEDPGTTPPSRSTPPPEDAPGAAMRRATPDAVIMACDGIAHRAMERAGNRLKSAIGRKLPGSGAAGVDSTDVTTLHTRYDATVYADLDHLLDGAFTRVPDIAASLGLDPDALHATLNSYCRALLAAGHQHDILRLTSALGVDATF